MKKAIVILISAFMLASLAGCGNSENEIVTEPVQTASETQSEITPEDDIDEFEAGDVLLVRLTKMGTALIMRLTTVII